jgi:hypothetical protein
MPRVRARGRGGRSQRGPGSQAPPPWRSRGGGVPLEPGRGSRGCARAREREWWAFVTGPPDEQPTPRPARPESRCGSPCTRVELRAAAPPSSSFFAAVGTGGVFSGRCSFLVSTSLGTRNDLLPEPRQASLVGDARTSATALIAAAVNAHEVTAPTAFASGTLMSAVPACTGTGRRIRGTQAFAGRGQGRCAPVKFLDSVSLEEVRTRSGRGRFVARPRYQDATVPARRSVTLIRRHVGPRQAGPRGLTVRPLGHCVLSRSQLRLGHRR